MILSGREIKRRLGKNIFIEPFNLQQLGPNSYNLRLHNELMVYDDTVLDMKQKPAVHNLIIPAEGMVLQPGILLSLIHI